MKTKILIIGGYGTFGGRIVELLEDQADLTIVVAGRSAARAEAYCATLHGAKAQLVAAAFDRDGDIAEQLRAISPALVIDASGPFQAYGDHPYRVIEACLALGLNYLDLADGSDFVEGVSAFDKRAREAGVFILSGVSSFPVLTAAVVRHLAEGMSQIESIKGGIAPSPYAGVGLNVIRAIAGYSGQRVSLRNGGDTARAYPFTEQMRYTIAPPGRLPLKSTLFSLVDVPDLRVLPTLWPGVRNVWMGAGPVPEILHRALIALAWLVRIRVLPSLSPLAKLMHWATNRLRWGEHHGGMFVEVSGFDSAGARQTCSWHMVAEGDDGPLIPSMAVAAVLHHMLQGQPPAAGARAFVSELELSDYQRLFDGRSIFTGDRDGPSIGEMPLYRQLLGPAWDMLPDQIRTTHDVAGTSRATGRARVERGKGLVARMAATLFGFPEPAEDTPVEVVFEATGGQEKWARTFAARSFTSYQFPGRGRSERLLCERFGALTFAMALVLEGDHLHLVLRRWSAFGIPLPLFAGPRSTAFETVTDGRFNFHVEIAHPLTGLIVRYRGWLVPDA